MMHVSIMWCMYLWCVYPWYMYPWLCCMCVWCGWNFVTNQPTNKANSRSRIWYFDYHQRIGILLLKKRENRDKCSFATKQCMFGVFSIDEILCYRGSPFPASRTLCHPASAHNALTLVPNYLISNNTWRDIPQQLTKFVFWQFSCDHNVNYWESLVNCPFLFFMNKVLGSSFTKASPISD